jgi:surface protein
MQEEDGNTPNTPNTAQATVLGVMPWKKTAPPVEMETEAARRPTYKDSFGSARPLAAPAAMPPIVRPAQNHETAPGGARRITYMDSVGNLRPLAAVVSAMPSYVPLAQNNETDPHEMETGGARQLTYMDSVGDLRPLAAVVSPLQRPAQDIGAAGRPSDEMEAGARPLYKDSFGSVRFPVAELTPSAPPWVPPKDADNDSGNIFEERGIETGVARRPSDEMEDGARPMYKDSVGSIRFPAAMVPPILPPRVPSTDVNNDSGAIFQVNRVNSSVFRANSANGTSFRVNNADDTIFEEHDSNEDEGSDDKSAGGPGEWTMMVPESKTKGRWICIIALVTVAILVIVFRGVCTSWECRGSESVLISMTTTTPTPSPPTTPSPSIPQPSSNSPTPTPSRLPTPSLFWTFDNRGQLVEAVDLYLADNSEDTLVARSYGWPIGTWDVSKIQDFSELFSADNSSTATHANPNAVSFNGDISGWDVSSAITMRAMFSGAVSFGQPLGNWDVSSVTDMSYMFYRAESYDQPIGGWNVSGVIDMGSMLSFATSFSQRLADWDVSSVTDLSYTFFQAESFDQPLVDWDVSSVADLTDMFRGSGCPEKQLGQQSCF